MWLAVDAGQGRLANVEKLKYVAGAQDPLVTVDGKCDKHAEE